MKRILLLVAVSALMALSASAQKDDGNRRLYGKGVSAQEIVIHSKIHAPTSARLLVSTLNKKSPRNRSGK